MTDMMERNETEAKRDAISEFRHRRREGEEYRRLIHDTFIAIIREAAPTGGIDYDAVLNQAYQRLKDSYTYLDHSRDLFDDILNQLSIDRKIDSGRSSLLFVAGEQPWLNQRTTLGSAAIERVNEIDRA